MKTKPDPIIPKALVVACPRIETKMSALTPTVQATNTDIMLVRHWSGHESECIITLTLSATAPRFFNWPLGNIADGTTPPTETTAAHEAYVGGGSWSRSH